MVFSQVLMLVSALSDLLSKRFNVLILLFVCLLESMIFLYFILLPQWVVIVKVLTIVSLCCVDNASVQVAALNWVGVMTFRLNGRWIQFLVNNLVVFMGLFSVFLLNNWILSILFLLSKMRFALFRILIMIKTLMLRFIMLFSILTLILLLSILFFV